MEEITGRYFFRDGEITKVSEFDPSFLSDPWYIYEVFRVIDGVPLFLEDHTERLKFTLHRTNISHEIIPDDFRGSINHLIEVNELGEGNIKIVVYRKKEPCSSSCFIAYVTPHQYPTAVEYKDGVHAGLLEETRDDPNAKVMDVVLRNKANQVKQNLNLYETLLVDEHGCITEGSRSNVFFIKDDKIITPPVEDVLPGVTRKHVIGICHEEGIPLSEHKVNVDQLEKIDAVFITGTSRKVLPVNSIYPYSYPADYPLIRKIQQRFDHKVRQYIEDHLKGS